MKTKEDDFIRNIDDLMVFGSDFFRTYAVNLYANQ